MSSFSPVAPAPTNTLSGSRINFSINGILLGFGQAVSLNHQYSYSPINVLGSIETVQHVPTAYTASLTFNNFRVLNRNLRTLGLWPRIGKNPQEHMIALVAIPELTAVCEDIVTNTIVFVAEGCRVESSSVQAATQQLLVEDITCTCRRILLEGDV